ncbi:phage exclusion protein Lit family protein [Enterovirga sp. CN4-39]|uniref:phage exclusion protein Lit family protein n=1 Tax=Enterovirga sp. CN4-39 TaxID=3400910 RepID=UPI003C00CDAC
MDVSDAVNALFNGVVPERVETMRLEAAEVDRFRLLDAPRFLLQASYGVIQVSEKALRLIWLTGYTAWAGVEAYNVRIVWERLNGAAFDPVAWNDYAQQKAYDEIFDRLLANVRDLDAATSLVDFEWPNNVPVPAEGLRLHDISQKATFDLICIAGAFVFAHEVRHALLDRDGARPDRLVDEERECDRWALALLLDEISAYAGNAKEDPTLVRAKRILGIIFAQLAILTLTPRGLWEETEDYPAVKTRLRAALDAAADPVPDWFWITIASLLTAFARGLDALPPPGPFPPTDRELAYALCDALRST